MVTSRRAALGVIVGAPVAAFAAAVAPSFRRTPTDRSGAQEPARAVSVREFGAKGDGLADDSRAIQAAIDATSGEAVRLVFPGGTYRVTPTGRYAWAGGPAMRAALLLRSGIDLLGLDGATLKISDAVSTNAAPVDMSMLFANEASGPLSRIRLQGLRFDMNGPRNKQAHGLRNHAHIHVTGNSARADDVIIEDCAFVNTAGVSCIVTGQVTDGVGHPLGRRWTIRRCSFADNGLDTVDHSSIFGWGEQITVEECDFRSRVFDPVSGNAGNTACEVHGAGFRFVNNTIRGGWLQGVWVSENATAVGEDILIADNVMTEIGSYGVAFFGQKDPSQLKPVRGAAIAGNRITLNATRYPGIDVKSGICVASPYGQQGWRIEDNITRVASGMTTASAGVLIAGGRVGQRHAGTIERNTAYGTTFGVALFTYAAGGIGAVRIIGNRAYDLDPAGPIFKEGAGVLVSGGSAPIEELVIDGNETVERRPSARRVWGIHLAGRIGRLSERDNRAVGAAVTARNDAGLTVAGSGT